MKTQHPLSFLLERRYRDCLATPLGSHEVANGVTRDPLGQNYLEESSQVHMGKGKKIQFSPSRILKGNKDKG